jgi:hypothetical protein
MRLGRKAPRNSLTLARAHQVFAQLQIVYLYCDEIGDRQGMKDIAEEIRRLVGDYPELAPRAQAILEELGALQTC